MQIISGNHDVELSEHVPVIENDLISKGGIFAFVGPTGAGGEPSASWRRAMYWLMVLTMSLSLPLIQYVLPLMNSALSAEF